MIWHCKIGISSLNILKPILDSLLGVSELVCRVSLSGENRIGFFKQNFNSVRGWKIGILSGEDLNRQKEASECVWLFWRKGSLPRN